MKKEKLHSLWQIHMMLLIVIIICIAISPDKDNLKFIKPVCAIGTVINVSFIFYLLFKKQ